MVQVFDENHNRELWLLTGNLGPGVYACSNCGTELFHSSKKYEHHTPWPAFYDTVTPDCLSKYEESPTALKISCAKCGNGLGHEFLGDGPKQGQSRF